MSGAPQTMPTFAFGHHENVLGAAVSGAAQGAGRDSYYHAVKDVAKDHGDVEGQFAKGYFDALAPGTSQWERLGKPAPGGDSGAGAMQAANQRKMAELQRENQRDLQDRELETRLEVARLNANAQVKVAEIGSGPGHRQATMGEQRLPVEQERMKTETELTRLKQATEKAGLGRIAAEVDNLSSTARWKDTARVMNEMETWLKSLSARELAETFDARVENTKLQVPQEKAKFVDRVIDMVGKVSAGVLTWQALKAGIGAALRSHPLGRAAAVGAGVVDAVRKANVEKISREQSTRSGFSRAGRVVR